MLEIIIVTCKLGQEVEPSRKIKLNMVELHIPSTFETQVGRWENQIYEDPSWVIVPI
jgi:hypothetical protein